MHINTVTHKVSLNPALVARVLSVMACVLILASLAGQLAPYFTGRSEPIVFLSVDGEQNLPTFFSVLLILVATLLLAVITVFKNAQGAPCVRYWAILASGFLFIALDEATSIHEKLQGPMSRLLGEDRPDVFHFAWVAPGMAIVLLVGLFFLKFLLRLPAKTRLLFCVSAALYLGGAIVLELIGGHYAITHGIRSWIFIASSSVEEGLEMGGIILFIFALLGYMAETFEEVRFGFNAQGEARQSRRSPVFKVPAVPVSSHSMAPKARRPGILPDTASRGIREPAMTP